MPERDDAAGATGSGAATDDSSSGDVVHAVRRFALIWSQAGSFLHDGLLDTDFTPTEARVMFELGQRDTVEIASLRARLHLNSGYLSRILARFEGEGLLTRFRSRTDARRQVVRLTDRGLRSFRVLDERSAGEVVKLLAGVQPAAHARLIEALRTLEDLLAGPAAARTARLRPTSAGDLGWLVYRCATTPGVDSPDAAGQRAEARAARAVCRFLGQDDGRQSGWIAEVAGSPVGGVLCVAATDPGTAEISLLLVEPAARGRGIGSRLVDEAVRFSAAAGYERLRMAYVDVPAAERLARRCGFRRIPGQVTDVTIGAEPVLQWQRDLHGSDWTDVEHGPRHPQPVHENL